MANRDCIDYISLAMTAVSVIVGSIAAWCSWKVLDRDKWELKISLCQVDVEPYDIGPPRIAYKFLVKNNGGRAVLVSSANITVDGKEIPLGQPNNNTKLDSGDEKDFSHLHESWIVIDDVFLFDQDKKRWSIDQNHLREMMGAEKTRHQL